MAKLTEAWVCRDENAKGMVFIFWAQPILKGKRWRFDSGEWQEMTSVEFAKVYGKAALPPKGKKWLMDIEL